MMMYKCDICEKITDWTLHQLYLEFGKNEEGKDRKVQIGINIGTDRDGGSYGCYFDICKKCLIKNLTKTLGIEK